VARSALVEVKTTTTMSMEKQPTKKMEGGVDDTPLAFAQYVTIAAATMMTSTTRRRMEMTTMTTIKTMRTKKMAGKGIPSAKGTKFDVWRH
jgi:hypothetical protein